MPWITRWEMQNYLKTIETNRALKAKVTALENNQTARVPAGLERLVPGAEQYFAPAFFSMGFPVPPKWDLAAIERDLKHLDTYEDCNAGEALAKHLQEAEEYTGPGFWTNGRPPSWWDLRAPENSQSVTNNFTPCCDHADTQKEGN